jgi:hypothetical protein
LFAAIIGTLRVFVFSRTLRRRLCFLFALRSADQFARQVDERLARQEHGNCCHSAARRIRASPDGIDGFLNKIGALRLCAFPGVARQDLGAEPGLQCMSRLHQLPAGAVGLEPCFGHVGSHAGSFSRLTAYQAIPPAAASMSKVAI